MTSQGSPYARFRRALVIGRLSLVYAAAAELPRLDLDDALSVLVLIAAQDRERFDRAAARWLGRLALERPVGLDALRAALAGCELLRSQPDDGRAVLEALAHGRGAQ